MTNNLFRCPSASPIRIRLVPSGRTLEVACGTPLQTLLFGEGIEFPCGGHGRCKGCRIRVLEGALPETDDDVRLLSSRERAQGWRLACRATAEAPLTLELAQWEAAILSDDAAFVFHPRPGLGVAIDLGTTTLVAQLLDLETGNVLAVQTALNQQAQHGADIMSRIDFAVRGGQPALHKLIRQQIAVLIDGLLSVGGDRAGSVQEMIIVGNTVMHHLFCGLSVAPLAQVPFLPEQDGLFTLTAAELGWARPELKDTVISFLPCLGSFVGSDILAGVLATNLHQNDALGGLVDLGTNGEIVVGNRTRLICASTAAGPAFEGARISMGMRAATGAIAEVRLYNGKLESVVLGQTAARGICGSGLVDAVAAALDAGWVQPSGKLRNAAQLQLAPPVVVNQRDIRELQLAKGAIAAGIRILLKDWGASADQLPRLYLAGAFGNYINRTSARRIGLLELPLDRVEPAGNTALRGAKMVLLSDTDRAFPDLRQKVQHVSLSDDPQFEDIYVEEMAFPTGDTNVDKRCDTHCTN